MRNPFYEAIPVLQAIKKNAKPLLRKIIEENSAEIEELNLIQLSKGQRADGSFLPNYSITSVNKFNKPPGPIKLFDEGDFYEGITVKTNNEGFEMVGTDPKTAKLERDYNSEITGLQDSSIKTMEETFIKPELKKRFKRYLNDNIK